MTRLQEVELFVIHTWPDQSVVNDVVLTLFISLLRSPQDKTGVDLSITFKKIEVHIWAPFFSVAPFPLDLW